MNARLIDFISIRRTEIFLKLLEIKAFLSRRIFQKSVTRQAAIVNIVFI